ncbi:MAG: tRNA uridine-5-carboxymethylaminomethyl(34) synthesis GTPase MnmE [Pseudomonadota bacterium]
MTDTIFANSSGAAPAGIAVIRISGPQAKFALQQLTGKLPKPRHASFAKLRGAEGDILDSALVLWLPAPATVTGEDVAELHCHGGRAVVTAVFNQLDTIIGLRLAEAGEFTRRAFANGKIDLAEAEGLADLLSAETELQRKLAMDMAGGQFSAQVAQWRAQILNASAAVEAVLDFADDDDVAVLPDSFIGSLAALHDELDDWLNRPRAEVLREGFRVAIAGPPNAGKSTLFNILVEEEAAITAPIAGTTRDVLTRSVALSGIPFLFTDTAGLRDDSDDSIELIGIERARKELVRADLVLWLGPEGQGPDGAWEIAAQIDRADHQPKFTPRHRVSAVSHSGIAGLRADLLTAAESALPKPGQGALNARQHALIASAAQALSQSSRVADPLLIAENLRIARLAFDNLLGKTTTEDMLDALFGRFCIGK